MRVGDLIRVGPRFWVVEADVMGALGVESVVKLRALGVKPPNDDDGHPTAMYVPHFLLRAAMRGGARHYEPAAETTLRAADAALFETIIRGAQEGSDGT